MTDGATAAHGATAAQGDPSEVPLRPAATVMLVRDTPPRGMEVFMLQRTLRAAFARGMYVFPGGRVDDADAAAELEQYCVGLTDAEASALLQLPHGGLAYWVAAIRECFEEAGVLLARRVNAADFVAFDSPDVVTHFNELRTTVHDGTLALLQLCRDERLVLAVDQIKYVSHWITPVGEARRFDTRFFVARAPQDQTPLHDDNETIDSLWVDPNIALQRARDGSLAMIPPTIRNLEYLAQFDDADDALAAAATIGTPPAILPRLRTDADGRVIGVILPGDADYVR